MTAKRRNIWLPDDAWLGVHLAASAAGMNPSQWIASLVTKPAAPPSVMGGQAGRDAILRKINRTGSER